MSMELIAIISVGVALAGLMLTGQHTQRAETRANTNSANSKAQCLLQDTLKTCANLWVSWIVIAWSIILDIPIVFDNLKCCIYIFQPCFQVPSPDFAGMTNRGRPSWFWLDQVRYL